MIERPLMTPDELKSMPKGQFIVMKTGANPMISRMKLFFKWGIKFKETYSVADREKMAVKYSSKNELIRHILKKYPRKTQYQNAPISENEPQNHEKTQRPRRAPRN